MKNKIIAAILLIFSLSLVAQELRLPEDNFLSGWEKKDKLRKFIKKDLYNYINGGSEIFLEFGFADLIFQRYIKGEDELAVEAYRMESPEAALGIYLIKCGKETPIPEITSRNTGDHYQIMIVKGEYFLLVNNYSAEASLLPVMVKLANITISQITDERPIDLFSILPPQNLIRDTELLIRGPYALQKIYTLGEGDILLLKGKLYGVAGDYQDENKNIYTRILVRYPDEDYAKKAYEHLFSNLDSYIKVLNSGNNNFSFKDYQEKVGRVSLEKNILHIKVNLSED